MNLRARWPHAQRLGHERKYRVYYVQEWALVVLLALSRYAGGQRKPFERVSEFSSHSCFYPTMGSWRKSQFSLLFPKFIFSFLSKFPRDLFWASLLPSLFPYGEFFIPPFDSLGSLFFLSPFRHPFPQSFLITPPPSKFLRVLSFSPPPPLGTSDSVTLSRSSSFPNFTAA